MKNKNLIETDLLGIKVRLLVKVNLVARVTGVVGLSRNI